MSATARLSALTLVISVGAGCEAPADVAAPQVETITAVDTLVSSESAAIAYAIDLDVASSGLVFVADFMGHTVLAVDSAGTVTAFGRSGAGPNEFSGPFALRAEGSSLWVHDRGNGRMKRMSQEGVVEGLTRTAPLTSRSPPYILANGSTLVTTGGADSSLVAEFDLDARLVRSLGALVVPLEGPGPILEMIRAGEVPGRLRNDGIVAGSDLGDVWIALTAEGEIRRYGEDGSLGWSTTIEEPEMVASRELFFRRNREEAEPGSFFPLRYFMDIEIEGEEAWVLLQTEVGLAAVILVFDSEGQLDRRIEIAGAGGSTAFAVAPDDRRIVLFTQHDAQLLEARLATDGSSS